MQSLSPSVCFFSWQPRVLASAKPWSRWGQGVGPARRTGTDTAANARAQANLRWAIAEALLGCQIPREASSAQWTEVEWVMVAQHLLLMHALGPLGAVALESEQLHFLHAAIGHLVAAWSGNSDTHACLALTDGPVTSTSAAGPDINECANDSEPYLELDPVPPAP